jgi:hypothetical protein
MLCANLTGAFIGTPKDQGFLQMWFRRRDLVVLRMDDVDKARLDPDLILGLQLSGLFNALNANLKIIKRAKRRKVSRRIDQLERVLYHAAITSECLKTLDSSQERLNALSSWRSEDPRIAAVRSQLDDPASFWKTILKMIRDKLVYHYDDTVIRNIITDYPLQDGILFGESATASGIDLRFSLLDQMMVHYIMKRVAQANANQVDMDILDELATLSNNLLWTLKDLIVDLIGSRMEWKKLAHNKSLKPTP